MDALPMSQVASHRRPPSHGLVAAAERARTAIAFISFS
jgi:hypothetical protein